ncbi:hypothetical protein [Paraburkholderia sp. DHOC27]|uniref:hypothetical protein n=1 Tax=Paraburkholderia sp. DHOC27 TaxID=2303330 RepID=UPI0015F320B2|nr:hypothetical protein [Paraburkholderia sp. DHOC27]
MNERARKAPADANPALRYPVRGMSRRDDLLIWTGLTLGAAVTLLLAVLVWFG